MAEQGKSPNQIVVNTTDNARIVKILVWGGVVAGVIALSYFGFVKPILNAFGLTKNKDDRKADRDYDKLSRSQALSPLLYRDNKNRVTISSAKAFESANNIYDAKGIVWDNESKAVGSITRSGSLVNLSYISDTFNNLYGRSLQSYLDSFLENQNWIDIDNYIDKAKKF